MATESPLQQVERGELRPKVLTLYDQLFDEHPKSPEYWNEFFLLRCNSSAFTALLKDMKPENMISSRTVTRELFKNAVLHLKSKDLAVVENTLVILMIFLQCVYEKPFINYSSDVIDVLAGLDSVDKQFNKMLEAFGIIINEAPLNTRVSAIRTATIAAAGAYQTSLVTYFTHKDMFGAIMEFIHTLGTDMYVGDAFSLIGLLASFDKLESQNPYRMRLADFIDDSTMLRIVQASGHVWKISLDKYNLAPKPTPTQSIASWVFGSSSGSSDSDDPPEPHGTVSLLLAMFEFINVNKVFTRLFVESTSPVEGSDPALVQFITLCSWMFQTQHKSNRTRTYSQIALMVIRLLLEEGGAVTKALVNNQYSSVIPICQLRASSIPVVKAKRLPLEGIFDALQCCIRFNTKRSMDYEMYTLALTVTFQLIAYLRATKTRLEYHWSELWRTCFTLIKFMTSHPDSSPQAKETAGLVVQILATCLIHGDTILPDSQQYDDLFYKLIGSTAELQKFSDVYNMKKNSPAMDVILAACGHYKTLLDQSKSSRAFSSQQVSEVIKQGYQTLSLQQYASASGSRQTSYLLYDPMPQFKEADERLFFKNATKTVISDVQGLYSCI